ncbi:glycosyltransferase family 4 protein [Thalassospira lucentensis]|uniref:glycosyltransferase family 4 protein n=1 Tax=Thalassospira lucentensis TaxID=168935 RepID=UPI003AA90FBF
MANAVHVMHMCDAFKSLGHNVTLFCYRGTNEDPFAYYKTKNNFYLEQIRQTPLPFCGSLIDAIRIRHKYSRRRDFDLFYGRNLLGLWALRNNGTPIIYESHAVPPSKTHIRFEKEIFQSENFRKLVVITEKLKSKYLEIFPFLSGSTVIVAHDAANAPEVQTVPTYPQKDKLRVGYVGTLSTGKGADIVYNLAKQNPQHEFHLVGRLAPDCKQILESAPSNVYLYGHLPHRELDHIYPTFDIALLPNQSTMPVGNRDIGAWNSPMKLFEYMAYSLPIIASDLPNLREIVSDRENGLLAQHNSVDDWTIKLQELAKDAGLRARIGTQALQTLHQGHTWRSRAKEVLS